MFGYCSQMYLNWCYICIFCLFSAKIIRASNSRDHQDYLLCRMCGADAADLNYLTQKKSPFSMSTQHENLFGKDVTVQTLRNPFGIHFNVFALQKSACIGLGKWQSENTWFPGYLWKVCVCHQCGQLLGWMFEPSKKVKTSQSKLTEEGFYVMLVDNVLSEELSNSLLANLKN